MNNKLEALKGRSHETLEEYLGFTHYLETKDFEGFKRVNVDHIDLVKAFLKFSNGAALSIVQFQDGIVQDFPILSLEEIEKELKSLNNNTGKFSSPDDEDLATSFGFFTNDYLAEFMQGIIFFSGKEDSVKRFSSILQELKIKHFPPNVIPSLKKGPGIERFPPDIVQFLKKADVRYCKLGRNDPCHCGSEVKYKKCCMENDIKETGEVKKVAYDS